VSILQIFFETKQDLNKAHGCLRATLAPCSRLESLRQLHRHQPPPSSSHEILSSRFR